MKLDGHAVGPVKNPSPGHLYCDSVAGRLFARELHDIVAVRVVPATLLIFYLMQNI
jgi:hypothetical protein